MKSLNILLLTIAPLLSVSDAVAGAPAAVERSLPQLRRGPLDGQDTPWHRRQLVDLPGGSGSSSSEDGPPTVIAVSAPSTTDTATSSDTAKPSDPPTNTTTSSGVVVTTTEAPPLISISLPPLIPDPTTSETTTTPDTPVQTPDPTPTTTDGPLISISLPLDPSSSSTTSEPPVETPPPTDDPSTSSSSTISTPRDPDPPVSNTVTSSSSSSGGVLDPTDVFPTPTISVPSITTTIIDSTSRPPLTIDSEYDFLSATTLVLNPNAANATTTTSVTNTDPDEVITPTTIPTDGTGTTLTMPAIPSTIPMFITPPPSTDPVAADANIDGSEKIAILFQKSTLSWTYVLSSSETAGQILAYLPSHVASILELAGDNVKVVGLQAFVPDDYRTENDLMTLFVAFLPTEQVPTLAAMIRSLNSPFYQTDNAVAKAIAENVVASYDIASLEGVNNENGSSTTPSSNTTKADNSRRNAIIGVTVTFGIIALIVLIWWGVRTYRTRRESMHKRLSYGGTANYGATGRGMTEVGGYTATRAESPPMLHNPFMTEREREEEARGIRRNSFYAIGPDDASIEEETFDYLSHRNSAYSGGGGATGLQRSGSGGSGGARWAGGSSNQGHGQRRLVVGQPISQPILRESSMGNW